MGKKGKRSNKSAANNNRKKNDNGSDDDDRPTPKTKSTKESSRKTKGGRGKQTKKNGKKEDDRDNHFRASLQADGRYSIVEMDADGNCLFRSLSDQLFHDHGNCHVDVRSAVCDYIQRTYQTIETDTYSTSCLWNVPG